jgi:hypothetical protein
MQKNEISVEFYQAFKDCPIIIDDYLLRASVKVNGFKINYYQEYILDRLLGYIMDHALPALTSSSPKKQ